MKTDKELLQIMLDNKQHFCYGLCYWAANLYYYDILTEDEYFRLDHYISENLPTFTWYKLLHPLITTIGTGYCWEKDNIAPRIKWIEAQIKKLEV